MNRAYQHPLGEPLLAEIDDVVRLTRRRGAQRLDIAVTAARLGISVERRDLSDHLLGLTLDDRRVLLNSRGLPKARLLFVFAHEVAHVLRRRGRFRGVAERDEEWFADWFARELVLPRGLAQRPWTETRLAAFAVERETLALQLAAAGAAPPLMREGDRVLCGTCGPRPHRAHCVCSAIRGLSREEIRVLPATRDVVFREPHARVGYQLALYSLLLQSVLREREGGRTPNELREKRDERPAPDPRTRLIVARFLASFVGTSSARAGLIPAAHLKPTPAE